MLTRHDLHHGVRQTDLARVANVTRSSLRDWLHRYMGRSFRRLQLRGHQLTARDALAVLAARATRSTGESIETATRVLEIIRGYQTAALAESLVRGASCLYVVDGRVMPTLISRKSLTCQETRAMVRAARAEGVEPRESIIDIGPMAYQLSVVMAEARVATRIPGASVN